MADLSDPLLALGVSRETILRLEQLLAVMKKWNPVINLVAKSTIPGAWQRHILDSAQLFALAPPTAKIWADLGSGGGFPGLVIACIAVELRPDLRVTLVEADQRKSTFLRQASQQLQLPTTVRTERIEAVAPLGADVVSARALASLGVLCGFASRHLAPGGVALFPKGVGHAEELAQASKTWAMAVSHHPSKTDPAAVILKIEGLTHV